MRKERDEPTDLTRGQDFGRFPSGRSRFVSAHFSDLEDAMEAARMLEARGYERDRITVFMSRETRYYYLEFHPDFSEVGDQAAVVDHLEVEEKGKTMEGAGAGGLVGALVGSRLSEYRADRFKALLQDGYLIVGVEATTEAEGSDLTEQLRDHGGTVVSEGDAAEGD